MKTARMLSWLGFLWLAGTALAQDALLRTHLEKDHGWVGERLTWVVELYAPGYFNSAPTFDCPDPQGLQLLPPSGRPILRRETVHGTAYTVQRYELAVFARQAGERTIPPVTVKFEFKRHPMDPAAESVTLQTEPVVFSAKLPDGAKNIGNLISAHDLRLTESWSPVPDGAKIKVGDAFTRTITFSAPDIPGMAFPPFPAGKIPGLGIYAKPPTVQDRGQGDGYTPIGRSRETITYVCQQAGRFVIPAARLTWFDLGSQQLKTADLPEHVLNVAPNPAMAQPAAPEQKPEAGKSSFVWPEKRQIIAGLGIIAAIVVLAWLLWRTRRIWPWMLAKFRPVRLVELNPSGES